ncbi:MAG: hypothetical protein ABWY64_12035, partial [Tardiphaga sp.]
SFLGTHYTRINNLLIDAFAACSCNRYHPIVDLHDMPNFAPLPTSTFWNDKRDEHPIAMQRGHFGVAIAARRVSNSDGSAT